MKQLAQPEIADIVDVLVMNDASSDNTNWLAKEYGCAVVTHVFNLGYGSGLQLGYKYAIRRGYSYVIQMDADGQHDVCNIPKIYQRLKEKEEEEDIPPLKTKDSRADYAKRRRQAAKNGRRLSG